MMSIRAELMPCTWICRAVRTTTSSSTRPRMALTAADLTSLLVLVQSCSFTALSLASDARFTHASSSPSGDTRPPLITDMVIILPSSISGNVHTRSKYRWRNTDCTCLMLVA